MIIRRKAFTLCKSYLQIRIKRGKKGLDQAVESIKSRQTYDQADSPDGHSSHRDCRNDIDQVGLLFGEEISFGYVKREVQYGI